MIGLCGVAGPVHVASCRGAALFEPFEVAVEILKGVGAYPFTGIAERQPVGHFADDTGSLRLITPVAWRTLLRNCVSCSNGRAALGKSGDRGSVKSCVGRVGHHRAPFGGTGESRSRSLI